MGRCATPPWGRTTARRARPSSTACKRLLAEALDAGAFGFSSGLVYAPSAFSKTDELIALSRSMASRGGQYFTHMRGEAHTLLDSIAEAVRICEEGEVPLQIAHLKAIGRENWPLFDRALELIAAARQRGLDVTADVYPYAASSTFMSAILPQWVHDGGMREIPGAHLRSGDPRAHRRRKRRAGRALAHRAGDNVLERDRDRHLSEPLG